MGITCKPLKHHMYTIWESHAHYLGITCTPHENHMQTTETSYVHHMETTCQLLRHHMHTTLETHSHQESHIHFSGKMQCLPTKKKKLYLNTTNVQAPALLQRRAQMIFLILKYLVFVTVTFTFVQEGTRLQGGTEEHLNLSLKWTMDLA